MNLKVSVIIPVYNVCPYLHDALDSVTGQTYSNLEIILVDDGSDDGSGEVCDEYAGLDPRIRVIHQYNKGLSGARNTGLDAMTGDVIAFLDPDDAYESSFIEEALSAMVREEADLVICKYSIHYTVGNMTHLPSDRLFPAIAPGLHERSEILDALLKHNINASVWNKLYRKELWESLRFREGHVFEDAETMYKVLSHIGKVYVLQDRLYYHRKRPGSITNDYTYKNIEDYILSYINTEAYVRENSPSVFSDAQLSTFEQLLLKRMLIGYYNSRKITGTDKRKYRTELRKLILETGEKHGVSGSSRRIRNAYNMLKKIPLLFDLCYPCYRFVILAYNKVSGR